MLTIFYDGTCPLCAKEMDALRQYDPHGELQLENIYAEDFSTRFPQIDQQKANEILHAQTADGQLLLGLDATYAAWNAVNKKPWIASLRWPLIKPIADLAYLFFARHRYNISWLFTGQKRCDFNAEGYRQK